MPVQTYVVSATGARDLMNADPDFVGRLVVELKTVSGTYSCTPQIKMTDGSGTAYDKAYTIFPAETATTAGTAITSDGIYEMTVDGCIGVLNFTSVSGSVKVFVRPLAG